MSLIDIFTSPLSPVLIDGGNEAEQVAAAQARGYPVSVDCLQRLLRDVLLRPRGLLQLSLSEEKGGDPPAITFTAFAAVFGITGKCLDMILFNLGDNRDCLDKYGIWKWIWMKIYRDYLLVRSSSTLDSLAQ